MSKKSAIKRSDAGSRLQSAMEFLLTYGWAILIITVVLAVLYSLGIFNTGGLTPKTQPGACQIYRPEGSLSTFDINTEGVCSNGLPNYVAKFNGKSAIQVSDGPGLAILPQDSGMTVSVWLYFVSVSQAQDSGNYIFDRLSGSGDCMYSFPLLSGPTLRISDGCGDGYTCSTCLFSQNQWYNFVGTIAPNPAGSGNVLETYYINGAEVAQGTVTGWSSQTTTNGICIGSSDTSATTCNTSFFSGEMANIQLYNTSLSANAVSALYIEGIGGVPINLRNLVAWWPLNGNANDYSGDGLNGNGANVLYVTSWENGYNIP